MAERVKGISTHVLDSGQGKPAAGVSVRLESKSGHDWEWVGAGETDADGRCSELLGHFPLVSTTYRLTFETGVYFDLQGLACLYPEVVIAISVRDTGSHYHIPLLLGLNTYTTYRGS